MVLNPAGLDLDGQKPRSLATPVFLILAPDAEILVLKANLESDLAAVIGESLFR